LLSAAEALGLFLGHTRPSNLPEATGIGAW
jgi:hypothetical protein